MRRFSVGSLFAGIGGIDLGLKRTHGFETHWYVENDAFCQRILAKNDPGTPVYGDICDCYGTGAEERRHLLSSVDVLVGGFPCQGISSAGQQKGISGDERSGLWAEFIRLIGELRPHYVLVENVSALRHRRKKGQAYAAADLGRVLGDLAALRYDAEWHCVPASSIGAPHYRDRVFIMAYTHLTGLEKWSEFRINPEPQCTSPCGSGTDGTTEDSARAENNAFEPCMGRTVNELSFWLDIVGGEYRWPARPDERQHRWEYPRVITEKVRDRKERIKALGNAVVPAVAQTIGYVFLQHIYEREL